MRKIFSMMAATALALAAIPAWAEPANVAAAVANASARSEANLKLDEGRKPAELLSFLGLERGMRVIDMFGANRYWAEIIAPAIGPDCFGLKAGDCAPDMFFNGPWYSEWDFKFVKRFPFGQRSSFDLNVEIFNAFNDTNFTPAVNPSASANTFRITNQQSGARIGQLVFRVNF